MLLTTKQYKLDKSVAQGFITGGITLSPAMEAGRVLGRPSMGGCEQSRTTVPEGLGERQMSRSAAAAWDLTVAIR